MPLSTGSTATCRTFHRFRVCGSGCLASSSCTTTTSTPRSWSRSTFHTPEEASDVIRKPSPLGADYQAVVAQAFNERWIDMYPNEGEALRRLFTGRCHDVHPYILMNYNGKFDDVSTLAHELGHTMQSYLSNKHQPFPTADYPIFTAEVASTFNEALLLITCSVRSPTMTPGCHCSVSISKAFSSRCSGRRSLPSSSFACTKWLPMVSR